MTTPIFRQNQGAAVSVTGSALVASGAYSGAADKLTVDNSVGALLADIELQATFGAAPTAGVVQLVAVDYALDGTAPGAAAASSMAGRVVGSFSPSPSTGNALTTWRMRINAVALAPKTDFYVFNNGTGQALQSGWVLRCQPWTPGT